MTSAIEFIVIFTFCVFAVPVREVRASYGDKCTPQNATNCTQPQLECTAAGVCDCSPGYIKDSTGKNGDICRLPSFDEPCSTTVGCLPSVSCVNVSGSMRCQCYNSLDNYYDNSTGQCELKPGLDEKCNVSIGCVSYSQCVGTPPTCQCNAPDVFLLLEEVDSFCLLLSELAVTVSSVTITATEVNFAWEGTFPEFLVEYSIEWTPADGYLDDVKSLGGHVKGLNPGTRYNFTIVSRLIGDLADKRYYGPNVTVCTEAMYGGQCDVCGTCQDKTTSCIQAEDGQSRCLCGPAFFNSTPDGHCLPLPSFDEPCSTAVGCLQSMSCVNVSGSMRCQCSLEYYYDNSSGQCEQKPRLNEKCDVTIGCVSYSQCVGTPPTCQCNASDVFVDHVDSLCLLVSDLAVTVTSVTITATQVVFAWEGKAPESWVEYRIQWTPADGYLDDVYTLGGHVKGLHPGTRYNFTIVSRLIGDPADKQFYGPNVTVCTDALYGGQCDVCGTCQDKTTSCIQAEDGQARCLCGPAFFNSTPGGHCMPLPSFDEPCSTAVGRQQSMSCVNVSGSMRCQCSLENYYNSSGQCEPKPSLNERCNVTIGCVSYSQCLATPPDPPTCQCNASDVFIDDLNSMCVPVSALAVSLTSVTITATEVTFTWVGRSPESGMEYDIQWTPADGQIDKSYPMGGQVFGLRPGTRYNFTIVSKMEMEVPDFDKYYYGPNVTVCTEALYGGQCDVCGTCQDKNTSCIQAEDGQARCLCGPAFFNSTPGGHCLPLPSFDEPCSTAVGCQQSMNCVNVSGSMRCQCYNSMEYYYDNSSGQCEQKPSLYERCNVTIGCISYSQCVATPPDQPACQCNAPDVFIDDINSMCLPVSDLAVSLTSVTITATEVTFTWDGRSPESGIEYSIQWTPADGRVDDVYPLGGQVSGLHPGTRYNFTIVSRVDGELNDPDKHFYGPNVTVCTEALYGGQCDVCGTCQDKNSSCIQAEDGQARCLCDTAFFNSTQYGHCLPLQQLNMTNVSLIVTARTVTITWATQSPSTFLKYTMSWTPNDGALDSINSTSARVTGLTSGTLYDFIVTCVLPSDEYNPEKSLGSRGVAVETKPAFNESCNATIGCQDYQHCMNQSGKMACQCDSSVEYYDASKDQCLGKPNLNEPCDAAIGCEPYYQCTGTPPTCQCNSSTTYYNSFDYQCLQMKDLEVSISSITTTTTNVSFGWQLEDNELLTKYDIVWTPPGGQLSQIGMEGALVSGLEPETQYNFTIVAESSGNRFYGPNVTVCTDVLYAGDCSICHVCHDNATTCMLARDNKQRCLCGNTFYNTTPTGNCSSLEILQVSNITATFTETTATFSWAVNKQHPESTVFTIDWTPKGGRLDRITSTGCNISGLNPRTVYNFTVVSLLPSDRYYPERRARPSLFSRETLDGPPSSSNDHLQIAVGVGVGCTALILIAFISVACYRRRLSHTIPTRLQEYFEDGHTVDERSNKGEYSSVLSSDHAEARGTYVDQIDLDNLSV
ncbi:hypothetical protein BsWGS_27993 [Bradybaena similaris]